MTYFTEEFIRFFRGLARNNNRDWFHAHKKTYEREVKDPFREFVQEMIHRVAAFDPEVRIEPKDAIFRIARDIRFSKDKTPYKTFASAAVAAGGRRGMKAPGLYFRFGTDGVGIAGGVYRPTRDGLVKIRRAIQRDGAILERALRRKTFRETYGEMLGDRNKRLPPEFAGSMERRPLIANKQFYYYAAYDDPKLVLRDDLAQFLIKHYKIARPVSVFLRDALR